MADHSTCLSPTCGAWADGYVETCPKCGGPMRGVKPFSARGWLILLMGLILFLMMGAVTVGMAPTLLRPGEEIGGSTFQGTAEQARLILLLFGLLVLAGAMFMINGIILIAKGRQSRLFTILGLALIGLVVLVGFAIMGTA